MAIKLDKSKNSNAAEKSVNVQSEASSDEMLVKEVPVEKERKLFANKKANIALGVIAAVMIIGYLFTRFFLLA